MARSTVLVPFGWYPDGVTRDALEIGDERDFGSNTDGLNALGMIGDIAPAAQPPAQPLAAEPPLPSQPEPEAPASEAPVAEAAEVAAGPEAEATLEPEPPAPRRRRN